MNRHKQIVFLAYLPILVFALFHWWMWHHYVRPVVESQSDLSRLAYVQIAPDTPAYASDIKKFTGDNARPTDILTIGDCFFRLNFQKYLAQATGKEVINITNLKWGKYPGTDNNPINMLSMMINSGYIDEVRPKVIILETIQRNWYERLAGNLNLDLTDSDDALREFMQHYPDPENILPTYHFVNNGNYKFLYNNHKLNSSGGALTCYSGQVCSAALTQRAFSGNYPNLLFFEQADMDNIKHEDSFAITQAVSNLNRLADKLAQHNIKLFVLIAPDKYTYYQHLLKDTTLPHSQFFERYHMQPKNYLSLHEIPRIPQSEAYWPQDTRWNENYQRYVAGRVAETLKEEGVL